MAKGKKKNAQQEGILESSEALQEQFSRTERFLHDNKGLVTVVLAAIVIAIGGFAGYRYYNNNLNEEAKSEMIQAQYYWEQDSLNLALNGDGNNLGFADIAYEYGSTPTGNLAYYYAGYIHLRQGNYELALDYLNDFDANDLIMQAKAYSLIGDVFMQQSNFEKAAEQYMKAANYKENKEFSPIYLQKAAIAYENLNDLESAKSAYGKIVSDFRDSKEFSDARKHFARLGGSEF